MKWQDEDMSPAEAKQRTLSLFNLWLDCRKTELVGLRRSFRRKYNRVQKIAADNVSDPVVRNFLKFIECLLLLSLRWTRHRIEKLKAHICEIREAISELNADKPDSAIGLLRENFPAGPITQPSIDGLSSPFGTDGMSLFYIRLIGGLNHVGKA